MNESSVMVRLLEVIKKMSENEQLTLLKELEERFFKGRRKHERVPLLTVVDYSTEDRFYKDYIQDISAGGVFIQTRMPFRAGQEVSLTFSLSDYQKHLKIIGEIVRITPQGIGVKFKIANEEQETMIKALLEMI